MQLDLKFLGNLFTYKNQAYVTSDIIIIIILISLTVTLSCRCYSEMCINTLLCH